MKNTRSQLPALTLLKQVNKIGRVSVLSYYNTLEPMFVQHPIGDLVSKEVAIHSDEGLTLETSVFESFTVANLPYRPCG